MVDMVIREAGHGEVTVVIVRLISDVHARLLANQLGGLSQVFWEELFLLVEVVASTLDSVSDNALQLCLHTHHIDQNVKRSALPLLQ